MKGKNVQMKEFVSVMPAPMSPSDWVKDDALRKTDSLRDATATHEDNLSTGERSRVNTADVDNDIWASVAQDGFIEVSSENSEAEISGDESV